MLLLYRFRLARVTNLVAFAGSSFQVPVKCFVRIKSPAIKGSGQLVVGIKTPPPPRNISPPPLNRGPSNPRLETIEARASIW